jgi:transcriptional regulator
VPTWNYATVHVSGTCQLVHKTEELIRILLDYVSFYEQSMPEPWTFDSETDFARRLATQVVGFRVEISRWEGKWKLGQNHSSSRRHRTIVALEEQPDNGSHNIAALMRATLADDGNSGSHSG